jgi:flagellar hook-associated protein 2
MSFTIGGMYSGLDSANIIKQLLAVQRAPAVRLESESTELDTQKSALSAIKSSLTTLKARVDALKDTTVFSARAATVSSTAVGTATATASASVGSFKLEVTQVASASTLKTGSAGVAGKATDIPSGTSLASSVFGTSAQGTFSLNGVSITIGASTTLNDIASMMSSGTGATATYNTSTGKFELSSGSPILLGTAGDTSDFLQQAQLFNNGTGTVTSETGVGRISSSAALSAGNFSGIAGSVTGGTLVINGVNVDYAASDSLATVLARINDSAANVVATYDRYSDQVQLTSKTRGALDISVADSGGGTLAQALGLTSANRVLSMGDSTQFKVNDGPARTSSDETLTEAELGLTGLSFTAIATGITQVNVTADSSGIKAKIDALVEQYNSSQNLIESYVKGDPDSDSENGALYGDSTFAFLQSDLRSGFGGILNASGTKYRMLEDLGIKGNASDYTVTALDSSALDTALSTAPDEVAEMFTDVLDGLSRTLGDRLDAYAGDVTLYGTAGVIKAREDYIVKRQDTIDDEIARIDAQLVAERVFLESQFAMLESVSGQSQQMSSQLSGLTSNTSSK